MREVDISEAIKIRINILKEFDSFCSSNSIKYSLGYGTLLGSVRHKGMIPWDDDIDVCVTRESFEFLEKMSFSCVGERYRFVTHRIDNNIKTKIGYFVDSKTNISINGVFDPKRFIHIDVFPVDYVPDSSFKLAYLRFRRWLLQMIIRGKSLHPEIRKGFKKILLKIIKLFFTPFNDGKALDKLNNLAKGIQKKPSKNSAVIVENGPLKIFPSKAFDSYQLFDYEGMNLSGICDYDSCLKSWYGDYMTPPPPEQRVLIRSDKIKYYIEEQNETI